VKVALTFTSTISPISIINDYIHIIVIRCRLIYKDY
jgi:hypothetical protein